MARERDYRAEYRARAERARQAGYKGYREARTRRAAGQPTRRDVGAYRTAKARRTPAGDVVKSSTRAGVRRAIADAAAAGQRVSLIATFDDGTGPKTRRLDGRQSIEPPVAKVRRGDGPVSSGEAEGPLGPVQVVSGPAVEAGGGGGYDAADLLAYLDMYDDVWDAIEDMWADNYP